MENLFHLPHTCDILAKLKNVSLAVMVHLKLHVTECYLENVFWFAKARPQSSMVMDTA